MGAVIPLKSFLMSFLVPKQIKTIIVSHLRIPLSHTRIIIFIIISLELFLTRITLLQAHSQFIYCNCVKFNQYKFIGLE